MISCNDQSNRERLLNLSESERLLFYIEMKISQDITKMRDNQAFEFLKRRLSRDELKIEQLNSGFAHDELKEVQD